LAFDPRFPAEDGILLSGLFLGFFDSRRISFRILEFYRIGRDKVGIIFDEGPGVCDAIDSPSSWDLKMIVTLGANLKIPFDDLPIDDLITRVAFHPKLIRGLRFFSYLFLLSFFFPFFKPSHPLRSSSLSIGD
jgi:hypothetical protein